MGTHQSQPSAAPSSCELRAQREIRYIDPGLGERILIVFSEEAHQEHLARLKKLGYKLTTPFGRCSQEEAP